VIYIRRFWIDSWPLIVNLCTEHFLLISIGTQMNCFVTSLISGIGRDIFINGSNVIERWLQSGSGHRTVLLNWPCIKSTIIDYDLFKCASHDSRLAFESSSPCDSIVGTSGLTLTLFRSSCKLSRIIVKSS
jgi:hypothetical protein